MLADVPRIARLHVSVWRAAYRGQVPDGYLDSLASTKRTTKWSAAVSDSSQVVLVAVEEAAVVGFALLLPSRDPDANQAVAELAALYVDESLWRSGYGTALLHAVEDAARLRGFSDITLWVLATNASARAFYEARGFARDGHTKTDERPGFPLFEVRYRRRVSAGIHRGD